MAGYNQMGGIPEGYDSILGAARQELVRLPDGTYVAAPKYGQATTVNDLYEGILGQGGVPPIGVQGTKRNRGSMPSADNSLGEPWPGAYDQTVMRNGSTRRDIIEDIPAPVMTAAAPKYSTIDTVTPLDINRLGLTTSPFKKPTPTPAERAIAEVIVRGGNQTPTQLPRRKPLFPLTQYDQALAIGRAYQPSPSVKAALAAPPPPGSRAAPVMRAATTTYSDQSSAGSQGGGSGYSAPSSYGTPVMLASGTASTVGAMGTAQGGRYVYQVQSDGSVKNLTTGRTTAPATR